MSQLPESRGMLPTWASITSPLPDVLHEFWISHTPLSPLDPSGGRGWDPAMPRKKSVFNSIPTSGFYRWHQAGRAWHSWADTSFAKEIFLGCGMLIHPGMMVGKAFPAYPPPSFPLSPLPFGQCSRKGEFLQPGSDSRSWHCPRVRSTSFN